MTTVFDALHLTGSDIPMPGEWARHGRCRTAPPELFFPGRGEPTSEAQAICARCPVVDDCRIYGLAHPGLQGIWGGLTGRERKLRRAADEPPPVAPPLPAAEPEPSTGSLYDALEQLVAHPGRWARVARYKTLGSAATTASLLRTGRRDVPEGTWQFEGRRNEHGGSDLYAMCEPNLEEATG